MFLKDGKLIGGYVDKHINVNKNVYFGGHHFVRDRRGGGRRA
jgi:hypothetical protein